MSFFCGGDSTMTNTLTILYFASLSTNHTFIQQLKHQVLMMRIWADGEEDAEMVWKKTHRLLKKHKIYDD